MKDHRNREQNEDLMAWKRYLASRPGSRRVSDRELSDALDYGKNLAEQARREISGPGGVEVYIRSLGYGINERYDDGIIGGIRFRSRYIEGTDTIELWPRTLAPMAARAHRLGLEPDRVRELVLAHELFHVLEYMSPDPGPKGLKRGKSILHEAAASAFARALLNLEFNPVILDLTDEGDEFGLPGGE